MAGKPFAALPSTTIYELTAPYLPYTCAQSSIVLSGWEHRVACLQLLATETDDALAAVPHNLKQAMTRHAFRHEAVLLRP